MDINRIINFSFATNERLVFYVQKFLPEVPQAVFLKLPEGFYTLILSVWCSLLT